MNKLAIVLLLMFNCSAFAGMDQPWNDDNAGYTGNSFPAFVLLVIVLAFLHFRSKK